MEGPNLCPDPFKDEPVNCKKALNSLEVIPVEIDGAQETASDVVLKATGSSRSRIEKGVGLRRHHIDPVCHGRLHLHNVVTTGIVCTILQLSHRNDVNCGSRKKARYLTAV